MHRQEILHNFSIAYFIQNLASTCSTTEINTLRPPRTEVSSANSASTQARTLLRISSRENPANTSSTAHFRHPSDMQPRRVRCGSGAFAPCPSCSCWVVDTRQKRRRSVRAYLLIVQPQRHPHCSHTKILNTILMEHVGQGTSYLPTALICNSTKSCNNSTYLRALQSMRSYYSGSSTPMHWRSILNST